MGWKHVWTLPAVVSVARSDNEKPCQSHCAPSFLLSHKGLEVPCLYSHLVSAPRAGESVEAIHKYLAVGAHPMLSCYTTAGVDKPFFSVAAIASSMATEFSKAVSRTRWADENWLFLVITL